MRKAITRMMMLMMLMLPTNVHASNATFHELSTQETIMAAEAFEETSPTISSTFKPLVVPNKTVEIKQIKKEVDIFLTDYVSGGYGKDSYTFEVQAFNTKDNTELPIHMIDFEHRLETYTGLTSIVHFN